jgi:pimeloyl-ACP methyl ester carboxylesterase
MTYSMHETSLKAGTVRYHLGGEGRPVLYLHSAGGVRITPAATELARDFKIFMPVIPGFDGTGPLDGIEGMRGLAGLANEFVQTVIGGPCDVVGHSFGGWVATWLAAEHPDSVGQLVLQCPAGFRPEGASGLDGDPATVRRRMFAHPEKLPPEQKSIEVVNANRRMAGSYSGGVATDVELVERLSRLRCLTLILHGTKDGVIPVESPRLLKERIPRANLMYVYDAAHNIEVDQPEMYVSLVKDFLTRGEAFIVNWGDAGEAAE